jgi:hypothetical protein
VSQNHSRAIILSHGNALIFQCRFFFADGQNPTISPSKFFAFDFEGKFARFEFSAVSTTIANDWSIFLQQSPTNRDQQA